MYDAQTMDKLEKMDEVKRNVVRAADVLAFEANSLRRIASENEGYALEHGVKQRLVQMRSVLDQLQEELAVMRVMRTRQR